MVAFVKAHAVALRTTILSVTLVYALFTIQYLHWIWRDRTSHHLGHLAFFGSFPWSLVWVFGPRSASQGTLPGYIVGIIDVLSVGIGLGINLAIILVLVWFSATKVGQWRSKP
jgi:hypothetical protein